jgi:hypothetical protein
MARYDLLNVVLPIFEGKQAALIRCLRLDHPIIQTKAWDETEAARKMSKWKENTVGSTADHDFQTVSGLEDGQPALLGRLSCDRLTIQTQDGDKMNTARRTSKSERGL